MKIRAPQSLALELRVHTLHSSVSSHRKAVNYSYLPTFHQISVFIRPMTEHFYLRHETEFQNSNFMDTCSAEPRCSCCGGRRGSHHSSAFCWTPTRKAVAELCSGSQFMATQSGKLTPKLTVFSCLPCFCAWKLCCTQAPQFL